ncbi:MAG: hypothetical protein U9Q15_03600 [Patescibacteria group bacterium]|nr:hypothetical protein [Patescibacteria group bacterium]
MKLFDTPLFSEYEWAQQIFVVLGLMTPGFLYLAVKNTNILTNGDIINLLISGAVYSIPFFVVAALVHHIKHKHHNIFADAADTARKATLSSGAVLAIYTVLLELLPNTWISPVRPYFVTIILVLFAIVFVAMSCKEKQA